MIDPKQLNLSGLEQQYKLPSGLLTAVMQAESAGNPNAVSPKGAQGLFQFMPATAKAYGINPLDPQQAAIGAARMYGDLSKQFGGDVPSMLAAYNWGSGNLTKKGLQNAPQETRDYIAKITAQMGQPTQMAQTETRITPLSNQTTVDPVDAEIAALEAELGGAQDPIDAEIAALEAELGQKRASSFLGEMGENFSAGIGAFRDLASGNYQDIGRSSPTPRTEALANKLFPAGSEGTFTSALSQLGNLKPSDVSGALLEKFGQTPEGKALTGLGGIIPSWNATGTALNRYVFPEVEKATGIAPENIQLATMAAAPLGLKSASKVKTPEVTLAKGALKSIKGGTETAKQGLKARTAEQLVDAQSAFDSKVSSLYKSVDDAGAVISEGSLGKLVTDMDKALSEKPFIPQLNPKTLSVVNAVKDAAQKGAIRLTDLDQYRRLLSGIKDEDGVSASAIRGSIDDYLSSLGEGDFAAGGTSAVDSLLQARATAAKAKRFQKVSDILIKADGDANKIKSGLRKFMEKKENLRGFDKQEVSALKRAASMTSGERILKTLGKFGFDLGTSTSPGNSVAPVVGAIFGASGGPITAGAVPLVGTAARYGQKLAARAKSENLLQTIEGHQPQAVKTPLNKTAAKFDRKITNKVGAN